MTNLQTYRAFADRLWQWYATHKRELPWRDLDISDDAERAYHILVSEIMLQQTQVSRVKIVYRNFLEQFPNLPSLAAASNATVIQAWRGMGYNNRALRLRDAAREVENGKWKMESDGGKFPVNMHDLQSLPGVGHYTAAAIRNFAFNLPTPCLDTNIRRIIHRAFYGPEKADGTWRVSDKRLLKDAATLLDIAIDTFSTIHFPFSTCQPRAGAEWHAALMDFGSLVCTKRNPKWDICPLTQAGLMKAAYKVRITKRVTKKEPGRFVGAKFVPNRIFRGKVVDELRDESAGLTISEIGRRVCLDWNEQEHKQWLEGIVEALKKDHLVRVDRQKVLLVA